MQVLGLSFILFMLHDIGTEIMQPQTVIPNPKHLHTYILKTDVHEIDIVFA